MTRSPPGGACEPNLEAKRAAPGEQACMDEQGPSWLRLPRAVEGWLTEPRACCVRPLPLALPPPWAWPRPLPCAPVLSTTSRETQARRTCWAETPELPTRANVPALPPDELAATAGAAKALRAPRPARTRPVRREEDAREEDASEELEERVMAGGGRRGVNGERREEGDLC